MPDRSVTVIFYEMIGAVVVVSLVFSAVETGFAAGFAQVRWQDAAGTSSWRWLVRLIPMCQMVADSALRIAVYP